MITEKLKITGGNNFTYDFNDFKRLDVLLKDLCFNKTTIDDAEMKQDEFNAELIALSNYTPKVQIYIVKRKNLLYNAKNFSEGRKKIIEGFKNGILLLNHDD